MKTTTGTCCYAGIEFGSSPMPKIQDWEWESGSVGPPRFWTNFEDGELWTCPECGTVYVATWVPDRVGPYIVTCAHWEWRLEKPWERLWRRLRASWSIR